MGVFPVLTSSRDVNVALVEEQVGAAFRFLDDDRAVATHREPGQTVLAKVLPDVFFEVELDWQEQAVFVLVGEPVDGGLPGGYYVDPQGRKVRWHLSAALDRSPDPDVRELAGRLRQVTRRSGPEAMVAQAETFAEVVREVLPYLPDLLRLLQR
jgi:hypothetical protein